MAYFSLPLRINHMHKNKFKITIVKHTCPIYKYSYLTLGCVRVNYSLSVHLSPIMMSKRLLLMVPMFLVSA